MMIIIDHHVAAHRLRISFEMLLISIFQQPSRRRLLRVIAPTTGEHLIINNLKVLLIARCRTEL